MVSNNVTLWELRQVRELRDLLAHARTYFPLVTFSMTRLLMSNMPDSMKSPFFCSRGLVISPKHTSWLSRKRDTSNSTFSILMSMNRIRCQWIKLKIWMSMNRIRNIRKNDNISNEQLWCNQVYYIYRAKRLLFNNRKKYDHYSLYSVTAKMTPSPAKTRTSLTKTWTSPTKTWKSL